MKLTSLIIALAAALGASNVLAANEIKLLQTETYVQNYYIGANVASFRAVLANLGYAKQVNVHAKLADGTWTDIPLSYVGPADNGREVWSAYSGSSGTTSRFGNTIVFALSYTVNGQTYWDNNNGTNYSISANGGDTLFGTNVLVSPYYGYVDPTANLYHGVVTLANISPTKQVKVTYSLDGWKTSNTVNATYNTNFWRNNYINVSNPNSAGFEDWNFDVPVGSTATQLQYAVSYTVNGQTYWDNNFGRNYAVNIGR